MHFAVLLMGEHFIGLGDNKTSADGFFVTRCVAAENAEEAGTKAIELISREDKVVGARTMHSTIVCKQTVVIPEEIAFDGPELTIFEMAQSGAD